MMRRFDTPYMADWFAISLRWVVLVGLIVSLGLAQRIGHRSHVAPGYHDHLEPCMTALASMNIRITYHRRISIFVDLLLAGAFFWVQGGLRGPAFWAGLLPILTGSIYFEFWGAIDHLHRSISRFWFIIRVPSAHMEFFLFHW
jgi:hypothetical protein